MTMHYFRHLGTLAAFGLGLTAMPAQAATFIGLFSGNDCVGGAFTECFATQSGVNIYGDFPSPAVVKFNGNESDLPFSVDSISSDFGSVDGSEFALGFDDTTVSFTYTPGLGDPEIHYFAIKQGRQYALYYDDVAILGDSVDLSGVNWADASPNNFSHITFFNTGSTPAVPEPGTWAMMLIGFGAIGFGMRRRKDKTTIQRLRLSYT